MNADIATIIDDLASELGTDAPYFRKPDDKLHLSGLEIATIIATGLVVSYLTGVYKGAKDSLEKQGERDGARMVESIIDRLAGIKERLLGIKTEKADDILPATTELQQELTSVVNVEQVGSLVRERPEANAQARVEVRFYLEGLRYPKDALDERTDEFVDRLRRDLAEPD